MAEETPGSTGQQGPNLPRYPDWRVMLLVGGIIIPLIIATVIAFAYVDFSDEDDGDTTTAQAGQTTATATARPGVPQTLEDVPRIKAQDLKTLFDAREMAVVDVRDRSAYDAAHIPGTISAPWAEFMRQMPALPRDTQIVTYCT